jgi:hypothetical protein
VAVGVEISVTGAGVNVGGSRAAAVCCGGSKVLVAVLVAIPGRPCTWAIAATVGRLMPSPGAQDARKNKPIRKMNNFRGCIYLQL